MTLFDLKQHYLSTYRDQMMPELRRIIAAAAPHQKKAKEVNSSISTVHERLRNSIVASNASVNEIQQQLIVLQYCTSVASLEFRHKVWPYEYMAFSRRVGELWERFCCAAWDSPSKPNVQRINPPSFSAVEDIIKARLAHHPIDGELRKYMNEAFDMLFELVGEVSMKEDEVFVASEVPHVIDFKSGFGSNEKGNTSRLLAVGRAYKLWRPATRLFLLVRQEANNNYLNVIRRSGLWDVRCGAEAYSVIDQLTGSDMGAIRSTVVDFEKDLSANLWKHLSSSLSDLRSYLYW